jgi:hypothetical protein
MSFHPKILELGEEDAEALPHPAVTPEDHALLRLDKDQKMLSIVRFRQMQMLPAKHSDVRPVASSI